MTFNVLNMENLNIAYIVSKISYIAFELYKNEKDNFKELLDNIVSVELHNRVIRGYCIAYDNTINLVTITMTVSPSLFKVVLNLKLDEKIENGVYLNNQRVQIMSWNFNNGVIAFTAKEEITPQNEISRKNLEEVFV